MNRGDDSDVQHLQESFVEWGSWAGTDSPLYARLALHIAERPDLAALLLANPRREQRIPVLLFAAVHDHVLRHRNAELAQWYPSVANPPRTDDIVAAFDRFCVEYRSGIEHTIAHRTVQTNEVARSSFLRYGLWNAAQRLGVESEGVAMVDVGASAGLNVCLDHYRVDYNPGGATGPVDSTVVVHCQTVDGFAPPEQVPIVSRTGLDISPIDVADPDDARWLLACVWTDQPERFHRLEAAIEIARTVRPTVVAGDAVADIGVLVGGVGEGATPVVTNSWVLNYLTPEQRVDFVDQLDQIGRQRPLAWVWAESPVDNPELPWPDGLEQLSGGEVNSVATQVMVSTWVDGVRDDRLVATCHPHGRRLTPRG